jgi:hypothetical protein
MDRIKDRQVTSEIRWAMARDSNTRGRADSRRAYSIFVIVITRTRARCHTWITSDQSNWIFIMSQFGVLTNRKRAVIALIHSIAFLGVAIHGFVAPKAGILDGTGMIGDYLLLAIYIAVAAILLWLVRISRGLVERGYFVFCAASASFGLARTLLGDQGAPPAQYLRVLMLGSAVVVGMLIVRAHSRLANNSNFTPLPSETSEQ